jgi:two-component system sensor histidine kinase BaeS
MRSHHRPQLNLAVRISALAIAAALLTALIGGFIAIRLVRQASESGARQTLSRLADEIQADASLTPARSLTSLRALKIEAATFGRGGRVTAPNPTARDALSRADVATVLAGNLLSTSTRSNGVEVLVEARPTSYGGFALVQPRSEALSLGNTASRRLFVALLVACAVAALLGVAVAAQLARPLRRTAEAAHALASGKRDVRMDPAGPPEVAEVAEALNALGGNLSRSEARQRDFLLSVSHDLRTPLTVITGYAESLADGVIRSPESQRAGAVMLEESRRLGRYVTDLLDLAHLDAQELRLDFCDVDLNGLVDGTALAWAARCFPEGVSLVVEQPDPGIRVRTDPGRLRQVLDGLLENALRVVPSGRPIVVASRLEPGSAGNALAVAEVRDGGPGLADDDLAVAFDQSVLYNRYRGVRKVGTGLGLAIVGRLVTRLGGTVEAGHAPEGGARFTVRLPALPAQDAPADALAP